MSSKVARFSIVMAATACFVACSQRDSVPEEVTSSSAAPLSIAGSQLNHATPASLYDLEVSSTSSTAGVTSACTDPTGAAPGNRAIVAFEMHNINSEDSESVWVSSYCGSYPTAPSTSVLATQITRSLVGIPSASPAWAVTDVNYRGQPQLVPLGPRDWVALVVLVAPVTSGGSSPFFGTNVAVLLSTDGGVSWGDPQLVSVPGTSGGAAANFDKVRWMAATTSQGNAVVGGTTLNARSVSVTWRFEANATSFTRTVGWLRNASGGNGGFFRNPVRTLPTAFAVKDPSIVGGRVTTPSTNDFLFLEWPDTANDSSAIGGTCWVGTPQPAAQSWKGAMSIDDGATWTAFPATTAEPSWPRCLGGNGSTTAYWRNTARPGLVYDVKNQIVNYAVTRVRPSGEVAIRVEGYPLANVVQPASDAGPATIVPSSPTTSFTTPRADQPADAREDQWMPALTADRNGTLHMSWYDSARLLGVPDGSSGWPGGLWAFSWVQNSAPPALATRVLSVPTSYVFNDPVFLPLFYPGRPFLGDYHGSANVIGNATFIESATDGYARGYTNPNGPYGTFTTVDF